MKKINPKIDVVKNILWAVLVLFATALVFSLLFRPTDQPLELSISQLAEKITNNEVSKILVNGNNLEITLADGASAISKKEVEVGLSETLKNYGVTSEMFARTAIEIQDESGFKFWASILIPTLLPLLIIIGIFWFMFRQARGGMNQAFTFGKANLRLSRSMKDKITFNDVAGLKESKEELMEIVGFLKNPKKFLEIGATIPRGVLLMGAPGTGKTLLARAVAGEAGVPFFHISASEFVEMFVGVGASRTRDAFATAKRAAPSILFIDEIDAIGRERGAGLGGGHDEREQTLNQILVEMDGFDRDTQVIVLAATNRPDVLDSALLRPGRFDRRVYLDLPDINEREEILVIHFREKKKGDDIDLKTVAIRTPGFSGADLANLINEAAILSAKRDKKQVFQQELLDSIEKVMLGPERRGRAISLQEKKTIAYHEAGHALIAASLKDSDPVHKISIVSRGHVGGYTLKLPMEESRLRTKKQFLIDLAVLLGGYVSEKMTFGDITTGASDDLKKASELSRLLVTKYGMSDAFGPTVFGNGDEAVFLGRELSTGKRYSETVGAKIDAEVKLIIDKAHELAQKILKTRKTTLARIANTLLEKEVLEKDDFEKLLSGSKFKLLAAL